jgi:hypothetical protein
MKGQIDMILTPKPQHTKILLGIFGIAAIAGIAIFINTKYALEVDFYDVLPLRIFLFL